MKPFERIEIETREVDQNLLGRRAAQLSVALGLAMRKSKEKRA
jgi:type IV pilus assembly protein PilM